MKVHGEPMAESKSEKYLGDIIHSSGTPKPNIARRLSRGWGKVNEILAILKEAPLGRWRVKAGLQLRELLKKKMQITSGLLPKGEGGIRGNPKVLGHFLCTNKEGGVDQIQKFLGTFYPDFGEI